MTDQRDFLVEIGSEELPPKTLLKLSKHFTDGITQGLTDANVSFGTVTSYATPRRLAVLIQNTSNQQPNQLIDRKGPSLEAAFDESGHPTKAALGFARSCGVDIDQIKRQKTNKGEWLFFQQEQVGEKTTTLLPEIVRAALKKLPIAKPMRWGNYDHEFVRPVHWVVMLFGDEVITEEILGKQPNNITYGHRFHHPEAITIKSPKEYANQLRKTGYVIPDFHERQELIKNQVQQKINSYHAVIDPQLLSEVTAIVEWPVILRGQFDKRFLVVPAEALISAMQTHQKVFPVKDAQENLQPEFIFVSNIESKDPQTVIHGNEKVIAARLKDAEFFYQTDIKHSLENYVPRLADVVFQQKLGSLADKTTRIQALSAHIAKQINCDITQTEHAALLAKADLMSEMVGEFPELQGIMGYYYAHHAGEKDAVATAIKEHYQPRFAKDTIPQSNMGCAIAIADKLDTLVGIFGINQAPTGEKDPFALRRAALGVLRIIIERQLNLDLATLIENAIENYHGKLINQNTQSECLHFIMDRLRRFYLDQGVSTDVFAAVHARWPTSPLDFDQRIKAVQHFITLPEAKALAAANKRVGNLLKKEGKDNEQWQLNESLLTEPAEQELAAMVANKQSEVSNLHQHADYMTALTTLAGLQQPVDQFFDEVFVMVEDSSIRDNRLALLANLRQLFLEIADISLLQQSEAMVSDR